MEDIQKYVFDPDNPKDFKAYKLLLKILRDKDNTVLFNAEFLLELFQKQIFTKEIVNSLWDKPYNFNSLSGLKKYETYIENYSHEDFLEKILTNPNLNSNKNNELFSFFVKNFTYEWYNDNEIDIEVEISNQVNTLSVVKYLFSKEYTEVINKLRRNVIYTEERGINRNIVYFLSGKKDFNIAHYINSNYTSLLFTLEKDYLELPDIHIIRSRRNIKPILLKKIQDIHLLLDFVERDLRQSKSSKLQTKETTFLSSLDLQNYFSIGNIKINNLSNKKEIYFLGENGDGKSLLLQAITLATQGNQNIGTVIDVVKQNTRKKLALSATDSQKNKYQYETNPEKQKTRFEHLLAYGVNRFRNDSDQRDKNGFLTLFSHEEYLENPVKWLQHLDYKESKSEVDSISLATAKDLLIEILDENIEIEVETDGVTFTERGTILEFNQLSDGYKSVIIWVCDLLARFSEKQPEATVLQDFYGVVLVDEIGLFLHPKWQKTIVGKLRKWFPNIQFIFTTHSPIVILGASEDAIFYRVYKEDGETKISEPVENKSVSSLMANNILTAPFLFGLDDARNEAYNPKDVLDTSSDYLTGQIRKAVADRVKTQASISEKEVLNIINEELEKYESEQKNDKH